MVRGHGAETLSCVCTWCRHENVRAHGASHVPGICSVQGLSLWRACHTGALRAEALPSVRQATHGSSSRSSSLRAKRRGSCAHEDRTAQLGTGWGVVLSNCPLGARVVRAQGADMTASALDAG